MEYLKSIDRQFNYYKVLGEKAMAQIEDDRLKSADGCGCGEREGVHVEDDVARDACGGHEPQHAEQQRRQGQQAAAERAQRGGLPAQHRSGPHPAPARGRLCQQDGSGRLFRRSFSKNRPPI